MGPFDTMVEAINVLRKKGYTEDFNLKANCLSCGSDNLEILAADFEVDEYFRFEGDSNPDDSSILYAISSAKHQRKGVLVDAYGAYAESRTAEILEKLRLRPKP